MIYQYIAGAAVVLAFIYFFYACKHKTQPCCRCGTPLERYAMDCHGCGAWKEWG